MTELVLASNNKKKIAELETLLSSDSSNGIKVLSLSSVGYTDEIVEDGESFEENALIKASVPASLGYLGLADDSGLSVDFLGGDPGIYSARYSGEGANDERNRKKLLSELDGVEKEKRGAKFVCVMALVLPENSCFTIPKEWQISAELSEKSGISRERAAVVRGECFGEILFSERGEGGFGYDSLFFCPTYEKSFAEINAEEKNAVSHRGIAVRAFGEKLKKIISSETEE